MVFGSSSGKPVIISLFKLCKICNTSESPPCWLSIKPCKLSIFLTI